MHGSGVIEAKKDVIGESQEERRLENGPESPSLQRIRVPLWKLSNISEHERYALLNVFQFWVCSCGFSRNDSLCPALMRYSAEKAPRITL